MAPEHTNRLIHQTSPYLLQHAHNPVDWYPWGEEALARARAENKMLLISIGYSSCHWCHVMERESFEDSTVAAFMNAHFINIKVDREERPDIDDVYMTACQLSSGGHCGWPLNSFAMPDGRPVWAGTYFPRTRWLDVLEYFRKSFEEEPDKMEDYAGRLVAGVRDHGLSDILAEPEPVAEEDVVAIARQFMQSLDPEQGGRRGAPKFPMPNNWLYLMHYAERYGDARARELVLTTLDRMMMGGLYDPLGGGFARYSTDTLWLLPHFEKMLYDNGQLLSAYALAYAWTGRTDYLDVVRQTVDFAEANWLSPEGGYYSSFDADSEGDEGKYYVWTAAELDDLLEDPTDKAWFFATYGIRPEGNWEHGKNILYRGLSFGAQARELGTGEEQLTASLARSRQRLLAAREKRVKPGLDDKVLTAWNALMLSGLTDAYGVTGDPELLAKAIRTADFLRTRVMKEDFRLDRNFKDGRSTINGFLDDYGLSIHAFLNLYQHTFDTTWLDVATGMTEYVLLHFESGESGLLYYTSDLDPPLVARRIEVADNVVPGANSVMARNLLLLGELTDNQGYTERARSMFARVWPALRDGNHPAFYSNWCQLMLTLARPPHEVAIVGPECVDRLGEFRRAYRPDAVFLGSPGPSRLPLLENKYVENQTYIYVCRNKICKLPTTSLQQAVKQLAD